MSKLIKANGRLLLSSSTSRRIVTKEYDFRKYELGSLPDSEWVLKPNKDYNSGYATVTTNGLHIKTVSHRLGGLLIAKDNDITTAVRLLLPERTNQDEENRFILHLNYNDNYERNYVCFYYNYTSIVAAYTFHRTDDYNIYNMTEYTNHDNPSMVWSTTKKTWVEIKLENNKVEWRVWEDGTVKPLTANYSIVADVDTKSAGAVAISNIIEDSSCTILSIEVDKIVEEKVYYQPIPTYSSPVIH